MLNIYFSTFNACKNIILENLKDNLQIEKNTIIFLSKISNQCVDIFILVRKLMF